MLLVSTTSELFVVERMERCFVIDDNCSRGVAALKVREERRRIIDIACVLHEGKQGEDGSETFPMEYGVDDHVTRSRPAVPQNPEPMNKRLSPSPY